MRVISDRVLQEDWDKMVLRSCEECGRYGCSVKRELEKVTGYERCEGWVPERCLGIKDEVEELR